MRAALCVDLEPDRRDAASEAGAVSWAGATSIVDDSRWLRAAMGGGPPVPVNWFVRADPQIEMVCGTATWALEHLVPGLAPHLAQTDILGIHPHNWRWCNRSRHWIQDWSDEWTGEVVDGALTVFERWMGEPARVYRHGDRFCSSAVIGRLLDSAVVVDCTLEPGLRATRVLVESEPWASGAIPHVDASLTRPFQPSPDLIDLPVQPDGRLTMVPLTTVPVPNGSHETLLLGSEPAVFARRLAIRLLDPLLFHLAFAVRSDAVVLAHERRAIEANLRHLRESVPDIEWVPMTAFEGSALPPSAFLADHAGSLAAQAEAVLRLLAPGKAGSHLPVTVATAAATELARLEHERRLHEATVADLEAVAAEQQRRLATATDELALLTRDHDTVLARHLECQEILQTIERTVTWRLRSRLLPVLRPVSRALRHLGNRSR